jgi:hypothetical protein
VCYFTQNPSENDVFTDLFAVRDRCESDLCCGEQLFAAALLFELDRTYEKHCNTTSYISELNVEQDRSPVGE